MGAHVLGLPAVRRVPGPVAVLAEHQLALARHTGPRSKEKRWRLPVALPLGI